MIDPKVTFVVPCYNLAHFLGECVSSILSQSYSDFEVLIMDDCSPDNTPEVAKSFADPRVIHVRNETNLRHLANYNKGIKLARGEYIWLISADDRLRRPYILEQYVTLMDKRPEVGYVFCPAIELADDHETELLAYSFHGAQDSIFEGRKFLNKLLEGNTVVAASGMVRRECYEKVSLFPLDMPYAGDWYLWCIFALYYDVAYFSEPMVDYRSHNQTMTNLLMKGNYNIFRDGIAVLTRIRDKSLIKGEDTIVMKCNDRLDRMITGYVNQIVLCNDNFIKSSVNEFEGLLRDYTLNDQRKLGARFYVQLADYYYCSGETAEARRYYLRALDRDWRLMKVWIKFIFLAFGKLGVHIRTFISDLRRRAAQKKTADMGNSLDSESGKRS